VRWGEAFKWNPGLADLCEEPPSSLEAAMRYPIIVGAIFLLFHCAGCATPSEPGSYYVTASTLNVRLAPNANAKITNRIYRQSRVDVLEFSNSWARISRYYDGQVEGLSGEVARWVAASHLSEQRPTDLAQPKLPADPRIGGIPKVGQGGLTERDVVILHRGAKHFIDSGRCKRVEWGDKSVSKPNTYYVNCGGPRNLFFKPSDLPRG
jgi:hypothetical protein